MPGRTPPVARRPRRLTRRSTLAALAVLPFLAPPGAAAQVLDRGTFTLYQKGVRIGEERFTITEERGGEIPIVRASGELNLKTDGQTMRVRVGLEAAGANAVPRRYEAQIDAAQPIRILALLTRDRVRVNVRSPEGEEMRQYLPRGPWLILQKYVAHQYYFVARLLGDRQRLNITVIMPESGREISMHVEDRGTDTTTVAGRRLALRHLTVTADSAAVHDVWLDGERVIKVAVPSAGWMAVRTASTTRPPERKGGPEG